MRDDIERAFDHLRRLLAEIANAHPDEAVTAMRAAMDRYGDIGPQAAIEDVEIKPVMIGAIPAEWIVPQRALMRHRLLHLHGGGYICGSLASHRRLVTGLARRLGRPALHVAYRLGPEHAFPAAHDDCQIAYDWLLANGPDGPQDAATVCISGDSVGGALAIDVAIQASVYGRPAPDALALMCPTLDLSNEPARPIRASDPVVGPDLVAASALYAGATALSHHRLSPLNSDDAHIARLPPTIIQASEAEYLLPDAHALAQRFSQMGRDAALSVWRDMPHMWHLFGDHLSEAGQALNEIARFLHDRPEAPPNSR